MGASQADRDRWGWLMHHLEGRFASAELREQLEIDAIVAGLVSIGYQPVLRSLAEAGRAAAGLRGRLHPSELIGADPLGFRRLHGERTLLGDAFFKDGVGFLVHAAGSRLICWAFGPETVTAALDTITESIAKAANSRLDGRRLRGMNFDWHPLLPGDSGFRGRAYRHSRQRPAGDEFESGPAEYGPEEVEAALLLVEDEPRSLLTRFATRRGTRREDAHDLSSEAVVSNLRNAGLLRDEYLVLCKQDSRTICAVPDRDALEAMDPSFVCPTCGRAINAELVKEILAVTDLGKRLLDGSRWMSIWITELLVDEGIQRSDIRWGTSRDGEELDLMVEPFNIKTFFELKDREFGLGDSYPFVHRVARFGGRMGVVATMDKVASDAKKFFEEQQERDDGSRVRLLEGRDGIERGLPRLLTHLLRTALLELASDFDEHAGISVSGVIMRWMDEQNTHA